MLTEFDGNVVKVHRALADAGTTVRYSTLTAFCRNNHLSDNACARSSLCKCVLCFYCAETLCDRAVGAYFEREADSPKLLKMLETQSKGWRDWNAGSCLQSRRSPS
jgi:hypothetical protein